MVRYIAGLLLSEKWFNSDRKLRFLTRYFQSSIPPYGLCIFKIEKTTSILHLNKWKYEELPKGLKYDIRKLENSQICKFDFIKWQDLEKAEKNKIIHSYNQFALTKNISTFNGSRLDDNSECVFVSKIKEDSAVSNHVYILKENRIRLLYSWQNFDTNLTIKYLVNINKYHTLMDIEQFRKMNISVYDFGGINLSRLNGIDQFKLKWNGELVEEYNFIKVI